MYPNLYRGLSLKPEDLTAHDSPLVSFDGKVVIPRGQIRLLVQAGSEVVEMDFIVVDAYFPYMAIVARPWLYALGAVSSTLHLKVKYPAGDRIEELVGVNPWLGSALSLQLCISLQMSPQPQLRGAHSNQGFQPYLQMRCRERQSVRGWRKLL